MTTAICPGSFDPVTMGHIDIIRRSARVFDKVIVLVVINPAKTPTFTVEERVDFIRRSVADLPETESGHIEVDSYPGLLVDYAQAHGARVAVKGIRAVTDFEYEFQQALINKKLYPEFETLFMSCNDRYMYLSSSMVKQIAAEGRGVQEFIPGVICPEIEKRLFKPAFRPDAPVSENLK